MIFVTLKVPRAVTGLIERRTAGVLLAALAYAALSAVQFPDSLSPLGARLITVLIAMLIIWITESVDYSTSAFFLLGIFTFAVTGCPDPDSTGAPLDTREALGMSLSGFSSEAWIMVTSALILASAVKESGLGQRMAYHILLLAGPNPRGILLGTLLMSYISSIFIPAQAANAALMCAVSLSILEIYGIQNNNNFAKALLLTVAFGTGIAGIGIQTSGAPTIQTANYLSQSGYRISWLSWAVYGMPFSLAAGLTLFLLISSRFPFKELPGGSAQIRKKISELGPPTPGELKLAVIMSATAVLWATEQKIHSIDSSAVSVAAVIALFLPFVNITTWDRLVKTINWGTLFLFGAAISLGQWLLKSGAAVWAARSAMSMLNLETMGLLPIMAV